MLGPDLAVTAHLIFEGRELLDADGSARVQLTGGDADLGTHAELAAVGELGRGVVHDDGGLASLEKMLKTFLFVREKNKKKKNIFKGKKIGLTMKISLVYSSIALFESPTAGTYLMTTTWSGCSPCLE